MQWDSPQIKSKLFYINSCSALSLGTKPENFTAKFLNRTSKRDEDSDEEEVRRPQPSLPDLFNDKFEDDDDSQPSPKKARLSSTDEESTCQQCNRTDPDELFLLSCAPTLKRLNSKQNAVARLKIQQILYEAEFGSQMELPYVTPASECGFDHIDGSVE